MKKLNEQSVLKPLQIYFLLCVFILLILCTREASAQMTGTYTISKSGGNYTTLGAAITDLNAQGISGPVIFNITADQTFDEPTPVSITATGTNTNTITFRRSGSGYNPVFNFTGTAGTDNYAIQLFGSDYVTFDGIEIRDAGTSSDNYIEYGFYFLASYNLDGCQNNTIKNSSVYLTRENISSKGIYLNSISAAGVNGANSGNEFLNNRVSNAASAYYFLGASSHTTYYNDGNTIGAVDGGSSTISNIGNESGFTVYGIYVPYEKNFSFYGTTVSNVTGSSTVYVYYAALGGSASHTIYNNTVITVSGSSSSAPVYGFYLAGGSSFTVYGNELRGVSAPYNVSAMYLSAGTVILYRNRIHAITQIGSGGYTANGLDIRNVTSLLAYNNLIYDIAAPASSGLPGAKGISVTGGTTVELYYNTVYLDYTSTSASNQSAALYVGSLPTTVLQKNNTFINLVNISTGTRAVAFQKSTTNLTNISASTDYNHYYTGAASGKNLIFYDGTNADQTIAAYKTRMANRDQNAISGDPTISETSLKPFTGSVLIAAGTPIPEVITDYPGTARHLTTPTIGAFEAATSHTAIDWCNLQSPASGTIQWSKEFTAYAQVYELGVTEPAGQGEGIECWIGYSTENTNPATWSHWIPATFNLQVNNNDEYIAEIGSALGVGTYYYASRFRITDGSYQYGGYSGSGGGFWDGTGNNSGVLTVNEFIADVPYVQHFDNYVAPETPGGWLIENTNGDAYLFQTNAVYSHSAPNSLAIRYNPSLDMNDWAFTPGFNLIAEKQYEVVFYYRAHSASHPERLEMKYGQAKSSAGMTSGTLFSNTSITNITWLKGLCTITPASSGVFFLGLHGFSYAGSSTLYVDDITIRVMPSASNSSAIPMGSTSQVVFGATGVAIQFSVANGSDLSITAEKIVSNPGGVLPGAIDRIANQYWNISVNSGTVDGTYSLTLDITGIQGVSDPTTLHLLKRNDATTVWTDFGVPNSVIGNLLTWTGLTSFSEFCIGGLSDNPLPVKLSVFNLAVEDRDVLLNWETETEEQANKFVIERRCETDNRWEAIGQIPANGNSNSPKKYRYADKKLSSGRYNYRLKMIDNNGTYDYSDIIEANILIPKEYAISQNYPNPFNPATRIDFQLPFDSKVRIELYSCTGERLASLIDTGMKAGYHTYELANTAQLSSGVYFYRIIATSALRSVPYSAVKKMVLMK